MVESVPAPTPPAPIVPETPETPSVPESPPATPAPDAAELYELPDGRKVDGATLSKEWKENFYPDYTRKSQKLAQIDEINKPPQENIPEWKKPDYVPKSYAEIIEIAENRAIERLQETAKAEDAHRTEVAKQVDAQIATIRTADPKLDENALFLHANKYGFRDLSQAYENMKYIKQIALDTEQRVLKNMKGRADPVAGITGGTSPDGTMSPTAHRNYGSALEFLQGLK